MRKYLLSALLPLLSGFSLCAQPCGYPGITLTSQADVDNLAANYPGCTELVAVDIHGTNITNLNGLSHITYIGRISLSNNPQLQDFTSLGALKKVETLMVTDGGVKSLEGLTSLDTIGHTLYIRTPLHNFKGLESVKWIHKIFMQGSYVSPYAFNTSFEGFDSLEGIGTIELNTPSVESFKGLENVKTLGSLSLLYMWALTNLEGLGNVQITGSISMVGVGAVDNCGVPSICTRLTENGFVKLQENLAGCNSREEVLSSPGCLTVFPVELISLKGESSPEGNKLTWQTSSETNNRGFAVERSFNAFSFEEIGFVAGADDSNVSREYAFTDRLINRSAYYRLKQLDWDGTSTYSKIVVVKLGPGMTKVYPNPARGQIYIEQKNAASGYSLLDRQGFTVMESKVLPVGKLDVSALPDDLYMLKVGQETFKVVVKNN
jgi:hypothetical protein